MDSARLSLDPRRGRHSTAVPAVLAVAIAISAFALALDLGGARALEGTTGPINVTVAPTADVADGQEIAIHAEATSGTMSEVAAHICQPNKSVDNNAEWGFQGRFCSNIAPGAGDFTKSVSLANTVTGDLTFKAGTTGPGGIGWVDEKGFVNQLTCDATHVCDLVVRIQSSVAPGTYFFTAPLTFAGGTTTTAPSSTTTTTTAPSSTTTTTTAPSSTTTSTTTASSTTTTTKPPTTTTTKPPTTTAPSTTTTTKPSTTTTTKPSTTTTTKPSTTTTTKPSTTTTTKPSGPVSLSTDQGPPGSAFTVESDTWNAGSQVVVTFNSDPIELGKLTAGDSGTVQGTFAVPPSVEPGAHTIKLDGTGHDDTPQTLSIAFTVVAPTTGGTATGSPVTTSGATTTAAGPLAFTGASTRDLASLGVLLLAAGLLAIDLSIRRRAATA